jgi:hypothetical protein
MHLLINFVLLAMQISLLELIDTLQIRTQKGIILVVFNATWHQCTPAFSTKFHGSLFMEREAPWTGGLQS